MKDRREVGFGIREPEEGQTGSSGLDVPQPSHFNNLGPHQLLFGRILVLGLGS
jgi:hypothetical protein